MRAQLEVIEIVSASQTWLHAHWFLCGIGLEMTDFLKDILIILKDVWNEMLYYNYPCEGLVCTDYLECQDFQESKRKEFQIDKCIEYYIYA